MPSQIMIRLLLCFLPIAASGCHTNETANTSEDELVDMTREYRSPLDPRQALVLNGSRRVGDTAGIVKSAVLRSGDIERSAPSNLGMMWFTGHWPDQPWSPDGKWIAVPISQFDGWILIPSDQITADLAQCDRCQTVRAPLHNGSHLWNEDLEWIDASHIRFAAGLSGDRWPYEYDVETQQVVQQGPMRHR